MACFMAGMISPIETNRQFGKDETCTLDVPKETKREVGVDGGVNFCEVLPIYTLWLFDPFYVHRMDPIKEEPFCYHSTTYKV